jgi:hypothetical protein
MIYVSYIIICSLLLYLNCPLNSLNCCYDLEFPKDWSKQDYSVKKLERHHSLNTLTNLKQRRRDEFKPDMSYDLDGDGVVSIKDYYIA